MRRTILFMALAVWIGAPDALAQGSSSVPKNPDRPELKTPVGNRQPRPSDFPSGTAQSDPNDPLSQENRALDRKIRSICRGC
jgi:hypothetical protein